MSTATEDVRPEIDEARLERLNAYWRAANYLGAAQLYLCTNALLTEPLRTEHIKPRLLGHWGTQPGLNLLYAHLNRLIQDTNQDVLYVVGPGHGAPAILANLYLEGTLGEHDSALRVGAAGAAELTRRFSWPGGHASHVKPDTPGMIQEGGELGYALAHAYGAAFDNPDLLVACVVGDGEAETGATAAAWHSNKFLSPRTDGAVLPILHLNRYKIGGPTIFGRMSQDELERLFTGYGYRPHFVEGDRPPDVHRQLWHALDEAHGTIRQIKEAARSGDFDEPPRWPMIVLATPKGWTCPAEIKGEPIEGTFRAHQLPVEEPANDEEEFQALEAWLRSYRPEELFEEDGRPAEAVLSLVPRPEKQLGRSPHANGGRLLQPLTLPDPARFGVAVPEPGGAETGATRHLGQYLRALIEANRPARTFRFFCPDETESNRLSDLFDATDRVFVWPRMDVDEHFGSEGQATEVLSEHLCEGWLEGYLLTGRHGLFACYEAFVTIIDSMAAQHAKWLKWAREVEWRAPIASLNYLLTSHAWRQDHNGYSHQGPGFINTLLTKKHEIVKVYLPPDANSLLHVAERCLRSRDLINLIIASKQAMPQWLGVEAARDHVERGASVWAWAGTDGDPEVVLACAGDVPTKETLAAAALLRRDLPDLRVRVVNVVDLLRLDSGREQAHGLDDAAFADLFTETAHVVFAFHGYPRTIHELIYRRPHPTRFHVRGYVEEGSTTTPFDMVVANALSRYHLAAEALRRSGRPDAEVEPIIQQYHDQLERHRTHIREHGQDLPEVAGWSYR